jgi:hypothetical protein
LARNESRRHRYGRRYILHLPLQRFMMGVVKMTCLLLALSRSAHRKLVAAILIVTFAGQTFAAESLEQTVNYLIDHVAKSSATFIRNGASHTPVVPDFPCPFYLSLGHREWH